MVESFLMNFSEVHRMLTYVAIFFGMFIEGEIILILAGILVRAGNIEFFDTFLVAFIAVILHDIFYWFIGVRLSKTTKTKFLFFNLEKIKSFLNKIQKLDYYHVFISKFGFSINRFVLIASGYLKMPFKKLISNSIPADFIWTILFISLGFMFAEGTAILKKDLKIFAILITIFLVAVIFIEKWIQRVIKKQSHIDNNS